MTDKTQVNIPLLRKAVEWVEEQEKLPLEERVWVQEYYVFTEEQRKNLVTQQPTTAEQMRIGFQPMCGTAYCVAGYIAQMVDERFRDNDVINDEKIDDIVFSSDVAKKAFGLDDVGDLFLGGNTAADIRRIAEELAGQKL